MEEASYQVSRENNQRLKFFVLHREQILDQMEGNFPGFLQKPVIVDQDKLFIGFHLHVPYDLLEEKIDKDIVLKFDKRQYVLQFYIRRKGGTTSCITLECKVDFTIRNSQLFIELCYQFLTDTFPNYYAGKKSRATTDIATLWNKLKPKIMENEVSG